MCRASVKGDDAWEPRNWNSSRAIRGPLSMTFEINHSMLSSDYVCLAGLVRFDEIPKRLSYHEPMLELPQNAHFHNWDYMEEEQMRYSDDWAEYLVYDEEDPSATTDLRTIVGELGGAGFALFPLSSMPSLSLKSAMKAGLDLDEMGFISSAVCHPLCHFQISAVKPTFKTHNICRKAT